MKFNKKVIDLGNLSPEPWEFIDFITICKNKYATERRFFDSLDGMLTSKEVYKKNIHGDIDLVIDKMYRTNIGQQPCKSKNIEKNATKAKLKAIKELKKNRQRKERELRELKRLEKLTDNATKISKKYYTMRASNFGKINMVQSFSETTTKKWNSIKDICVDLKGSVVLIRGYIQSSRLVGKGVFFLLRSSIYSIQCVCFETMLKIGNNNSHSNEPQGISAQMVLYISGLPNESVVDVEGEISVSKNPIQSATQKFVEIQIRSCHCISQPSVSTPFLIEDACRIESIGNLSVSGNFGNIITDIMGPISQTNFTSGKNEHNSNLSSGSVLVSQELRLDNRHIDLRTLTNQSIFRIRSKVVQLFRSYLLSNNFIEVHTPKIISGASEGGSDVFILDYFGKKACLAMSPQLHKQILAACSGFEKVYEIGPIFRAENSNTRRHLCEFTGMDLEMAFYEHYDEVLNILSNLFLYIFDGLNEKCKIEVQHLKKYHKFTDLKYLQHTLKISFAEGCQLLRNAGISQNNHDNISAENERLLGTIVKENYGTDFFIMDKYPLSVRPFYTMPCPENPELSNSYDFFIRGQEVLSGSQRIHDPVLLAEHAAKFDIPSDDIQVYIDSFKNGALPHGGGGIGLERFVMLFLDLPNIRRASYFPRDPKRISP